MAVLTSMRKSGVDEDVVTYSTLLSICERTNHFERAFSYRYTLPRTIPVPAHCSQYKLPLVQTAPYLLQSAPYLISQWPPYCTPPRTRICYFLLPHFPRTRTSPTSVPPYASKHTPVCTE
eukprot:3359451-Rhodomonas_salina.4